MTINCKGRLVGLSTPRIMGILNVTPDSFFDGGKYDGDYKFLSRVEMMLADGADFIDVGGYSSKPKADFVSAELEIDRLLPVITRIVSEFPDAVISVDTFRADVAKACIEAGAAIINDISAGLLDAKMLETVAHLKVPYIMMHMRGNPQTMQTLTDYDDLIKEMLFYFSQRIFDARSHGINDVIIDPGFGFAKSTTQNFEILQKMELFQNVGLPVLVGLSRKSMIYKTLETSAENGLNGTTALNMVALSKGAKILRVHDVKEAAECVALYKSLVAGAV